MESRYISIPIDREKLEKAMNNSISKEVNVRETKSYNIDLEELKKRITVIVTCAALALGVTLGSKSVVEHINNPLRMDNLSREIATIYYEGELKGSLAPSIASQNAVRLNDGSQNFYYNQEGIAKDLIKNSMINGSVDLQLFDYNLGSVVSDFGINADNKVGIGGRSNIDSVIFYLKSYASGESGVSYTSEELSSVLSNIDNFEDYLVSRGYVDKEGKASKEEFIKACDNNAEAIRDLIGSIENKKTGGLS